MSSTRRPAQHLGIPIVLLLALLVVGFVATGVLGLSLRSTSREQVTSVLETRNHMVQLRVSLAVSRARVAALETRGKWPDLDTHARELIAAVMGSVSPGTWAECALLDSISGTYARVSGGTLEKAAIPGGREPVPVVPRPNEPRLGVFRESLASDAALVVLVPLPVHAGSSDLLALSVGPGLFADLWGPGANTVGTPTLMDEQAMVIASLWRRDGRISVRNLPTAGAGAERGLGFLQPGNRRAYTGPASVPRAGTGSSVIVWEERIARSFIALSALNSVLVVEDLAASLFRNQARAAMAVGAVGTFLAGAVLVLFIGFLRAVEAQTRSLADLSAQKNVLLSLLSHNLKNHFSAIASQAHAAQADGGLLVSVDDAARVVSDCLYYVQFREGRYRAPPKEPVEMADLVDFLVLRGEGKAATFEQTIAVSVPSEPIFVSTNLNVALEALERVLVAALASSPKKVVIRVEGGTDSEGPWLCVVDQGPGLSDEQRARMVAPFAAVADESIHERDLGDLGLYVARELLWNLDASFAVDETADGENRYVMHFPPA